MMRIVKTRRPFEFTNDAADFGEPPSRCITF